MFEELSENVPADFPQQAKQAKPSDRYSKKEMILVFASIISISTISTTPMMLAVFHFDTPDFVCSNENLTLSSNCPNGKVEGRSSQYVVLY